MLIDLLSLYNFGISSSYFNQDNNQFSCRVFIDIGWRESVSGYDSHPAEQITLISVLLSEIPFPRVNDRIHVGSDNYLVVSIHAQDDAIALLHVKKQ